MNDLTSGATAVALFLQRRVFAKKKCLRIEIFSVMLWSSLESHTHSATGSDKRKNLIQNQI
jgi:hypothetical protein